MLQENSVAFYGNDIFLSPQAGLKLDVNKGVLQKGSLLRVFGHLLRVDMAHTLCLGVHAMCMVLAFARRALRLDMGVVILCVVVSDEVRMQNACSKACTPRH